MQERHYSIAYIHVFISLLQKGRCLKTYCCPMTDICFSRLCTIGSGDGLSPHRRQALTSTNVGLLSIRPEGTHFNEILFQNQIFSFNKMPLKMWSAIWQPFFIGLNVIIMGCVTSRRGTEKLPLSLNLQFFIVKQSKHFYLVAVKNMA